MPSDRIYNIAYVGLDKRTYFLIASDKRFNICCVNHIDVFLKNKSFNPINAIFKGIYYLRFRNSHRWLELLLLFFWKVVNFFSTSIYYSYRQYLISISTNRIPLIDFSDARAASAFLKEKSNACLVNNWWILPSEIIEAPSYGCINIHPSKLPQYAGSLPTLSSLKNGDKKSAVTFIRLNSRMDAGDILRQYDFDLDQNENAITLERKIEMVLKEHLVDDIYNYLNKKLSLAKQDQKNRSLAGKYYAYLEISWQDENARDIYNKIILYPYLWPLDKCYFKVGKRKIVLKYAKYLREEAHHQNINPGVYWLNGFCFEFKCKSDLLIVPILKGISLIDSLLLVYNKFNLWTMRHKK